MRVLAGYEIAPADVARDRDRILAVWARNLEAHDLNEHQVRYDWLCRCPIAPPRFWLAMKDGEVVGTAGVGVRRVSVGGKAVLAGIAGDFAVDKKHRMLQPALSLQKAVTGSLSDGLDLVYGLPNDNAVVVFQRQGYRKVGALRRYVKVLRTTKFLKGAAGWKRKAALLSPLADLWLRLRSRDTWHRTATGRVLEPIQRFDARFDDLWSRAAAAAPLMGVRTSDFLNWRYPDCPLQRYQTLALSEGTGGRLVGYITWYSGDDGQVRVADWVTDGSPNAADDLLAGLVRMARGNGAASVACELLGATALEGVLHRFGFAERECGARLMVTASSACEGAAGNGTTSWYFLRGDENVNTL